MLYEIKLKWIADGVKNPLETNNSLFEAALTEFSMHSFRNASLNNIIKEAGMHKGSFYYRFFNKLDLYLSLIYRMGREKLDFFDKHETNNGKRNFLMKFVKK
jgi:AcrR family transcriptional regulator